jgi:hypothetical protein
MRFQFLVELWREKPAWMNNKVSIGRGDVQACGFAPVEDSVNVQILTTSSSSN